tara:strand:- start:1037 stop:1279 length:243 start_codon:yes stop_codon:yes gene_type:complete
MSHTRERSIYEGVEWDEPNGKWVARYKERHYGYYDEEFEAYEKIEPIIIKKVETPKQIEKMHLAFVQRLTDKINELNLKK